MGTHQAVELTTSELAVIVKSLGITTTSLHERSERASSQSKRRDFLAQRAITSRLHLRLQTILDQRLAA